MPDQGVRQRLPVTRPERLEPEPPGVGQAGPVLRRDLGELQPLPLDDRHLPPRPAGPDVPGDVPRCPPEPAVFLDRMEPVVERVVDLSFDEPAADPQPAGTVPERPGVDPARDLV